ncbi:MAG: hypothetical protein ABI880_05615 [Acidobacteriota bacterium]
MMATPLSRRGPARLNYTDALTHLAQDIAARVPALSFLNIEKLLIFARAGRGDTEGATATCHCLCLPEDAPGYYFWRDERTGIITRRTEWFVARTPVVQRGATRLDYLISVALPRFCDQRLAGRKAVLYPGADAWVAKLDTLVHELYHVDPTSQGLRVVHEDGDGHGSARHHSPAFYADVAGFVNAYLRTGPDPERYEFLRYDFAGLHQRYGGVVATTFRNFPSYPQIYLERLPEQPEGPATDVVVPVKVPTQPALYVDADITTRAFAAHGARRRHDAFALPDEPVPVDPAFTPAAAVAGAR